MGVYINMIKKNLIMGIALIMCVWIFTGCSSSHNIPNGEYVAADVELRNFNFRPEGNTSDNFWHIKGDNADLYVSGSRTYKCKIIMEDDKLYFGGRTWFDMFSWKEQGAVFKYEVRYDQSTKSIYVYIEYK